MIKNNKRGAALMQVLLITVILAGITTMLLRASLSRTASARKTRRQVSAQVLIQSCMAQVNDLWTAKTPEAFRRDMEMGIMYCKGNGTEDGCPEEDQVKELTCNFENFQVKAKFTSNTANEDSLREIEYEVITGSDFL